jgi:CpXC protein
MSLFTSSELACPHCTQPVQFDVCASVNADRRPDLREAILNESFQLATCPHCSGQFRLEPQLNYLDVGRGQWFAAFPHEQVDNWASIEAAAQESFGKAYGPKASAAEREIGDELTVRVVFGWAGLKEKLLAMDAQLSDVHLEQAKLVLMRELDDPPLPIGAELRLVAVSDTPDAELTIAVLDRNGSELERMDVPREVVTDVAQAPDDWAPLAAQLQSGAFVDVQRLTRGE